MSCPDCTAARDAAEKSGAIGYMACDKCSGHGDGKPLSFTIKMLEEEIQELRHRIHWHYNRAAEARDECDSRNGDQHFKAWENLHREQQAALEAQVMEFAYALGVLRDARK